MRPRRPRLRLRRSNPRPPEQALDCGMPNPSTLADTLARIAAQDPTLHAFAAVRGLADALREQSRLHGPLAGLAVAVKDIFDTADLPTRYGSPIYAHCEPRTDAVIVGALRRAGALVIGKSATTEFAYLHPAATHNPRAPGHTPGGSSAGSAAAVAAGLVPLAVGSQTGGSVIRPASYCGVAGFKPSFGLLPTGGMKCFSWSLDTVGLFAPDVGQLAWFAQALSGHPLALDRAPRDDWVVRVLDDYAWGALSPSQHKAMEQAQRALQAAGARVQRLPAPAWLGAAFRAHDRIQGFEAVRALAREFDYHADQLSPLLRDYLSGAMQVQPADYAQALRTAAQARAQCAEWMHGCDAVLTPSAPDEAPAGYASTGASTWNRAWTLLHLPCVNVPGATGVQGLPMGLQLVGGAGADQACLQLAAFLEAALRTAG